MDRRRGTPDLQLRPWQLILLAAGTIFDPSNTPFVWLLLGIHFLFVNWHIRLLPGVEPSIQRMHVLPTLPHQNLRHTGAGGFVRSSAIRYDNLPVRDVGEVSFDLV
jgi:hypothetical protein